MALNREYMRRLIIQYFVKKGFVESFNVRIHPPLLQDLPILIPQLMGKVEIIPYVEDIEPNTGIVRLGWNLFLLGNKRMYLGESTHTNLIEIRCPVLNVGMGDVNAQHINQATPRRILNFIVNVLSKDKMGDITAVPQITLRPAVFPVTVGDPSGFFHTRHRPVY
jgi:hypothetical protein